LPSPTPRLIALDLDGTLLGADGAVGDRNLAALLAAEAAGITIVIATGRRHGYAMKVLRQLPLEPETVIISSNGAVARTFCSQPLYRKHMQPEAARWLLGHLGEFRNALVVTFDKIGPDGEDARGALVVEELDDLHENIGRWMVANGPYIEHVRPLERCLEEGESAPIQMMLCGTVERMRRAEALMLADPRVAAVGEPHTHDPAVTIQLNRTEYPERDLSIVDILPAGCSKGDAVLRLAGERGITSTEIMAVGDNWNDLSMLEIAGFPVLMGNAPKDLQAMARSKGWVLAPPHDADGVAEAIQHLCGIRLDTLTGAGVAGSKR
jgi:hydroxymethylpyrimidine pyrophosphatase-like HAD family hydrolase